MLRVLVIEDEPMLRAALGRLLRTHYESTCVGSADEALHLLAEREFDVVLCDVRMPGTDGVGFFKALERRQPRLVASIAFMSGSTDELPPELAGLPFLVKPFGGGLRCMDECRARSPPTGARSRARCGGTWLRSSFR